MGLALLLVAAAAGLMAWLIVTRTGWRKPVALGDAYHYYVGAKYFPEVGYRGLYVCTLAADLAAGEGGELSRRVVRDLRTLELLPAARLTARAGQCRAGFTPSRWGAFTADVGWFRQKTPRPMWHGFIRDHGFNASPTWILLGRLLTAAGPVSHLRLELLRGVDTLIIGLMWIMVLRTFGSRPGVASAAYWLSNFPARFSHASGGILRQPWLGLTVGSVCALRSNRPLLAGLALGTAAQLRIFPAALLVGPLFNLCWRLLRGESPRPGRAHLRLLMGVGLSLAVLLPAATLAAGGVGVWPAFAAKMGDHMASPLSNNMGLRVVASYTHDGRQSQLRAWGRPDPHGLWRETRTRAYQARRPVHLVLIGAYLLLLLLAARGRDDWHAALLGLGLIPVAAEVPCYYYSALLGYGLLAHRYRGVAAGLNLLASAGWLVVATWPNYDERYTWLSVLSLLYVVGVTARAAVRD